MQPGADGNYRYKNKRCPLLPYIIKVLIMNNTETIAAGEYRESDVIWKKVLYRVMPILVLSYLFANLDRINIGFAKAQMSADLSFSETVYGFGAGLLFISYSLFGVPSNLALQRVGARKWIAVLMLVWGGISTCMFMVTSPMEFYVLRFCLGAAEAGFFPGIMYFINNNFPSHYRGRVTAIFAMAVPFSGIIGGPLSGSIIVSFHEYMNMHGWQWMFLIEGVPVVLLGLVVFAFLPDNIAQAKWLDEGERRFVQEALAEKKREQKVSSAQNILFNKYVWMLVVIYFCVRLAVNTASYWMPTFIHSTGITNDATVGLLSAIPYIFGAVFMYYLARSSDFKNERRWHLIIPLVLSSVGMLIAGTFDTNLWMVMISLTLLGMGATTALSMFWLLPPQFLPQAVLAAGLGLISSFGSIASFIAPLLIGWIRDTTHSSSLALYILSVAILLGAVLVFFTPKPQR